MKMKLTPLIATAAVLAFAVPSARAEDKAMKCEMCECMKRHAAAEDNQKLEAELKAQSEEIDKLIASMNGSIGKEKIEAMAAAVTRLAEQCKALSQRVAATPVEAPKEEAHHH